jgi:dsRNA-specific ribonuclease
LTIGQLLLDALVCTHFYAHLARMLGLNERIIQGITSYLQISQSERVLAGQFEAFVGGMHKEMEITDLFEWFRVLVEPYAHSFERDISTSIMKGGL